MTEKNFSETLKATLESVKNTVGADTIIGEPMQVGEGTVIIPVSKVMVGMATGGMDYIGKHTKNNSDKANSFSGYGGTGVTVSPVAFLVVKPDGDVSLLSVNNPQNQVNDLGSNVISLLNKTPTIIEKVKSLLKKDKPEEEQTEFDVDELDLSTLNDDGAVE